MKTLSQEIEGVNLNGLEGFNLKALTFSLSEHIRVGKYPRISAIRIIISCFLIKEKWDFNKSETPVLFVLHHYRRNVVDMVNKVAGLVKDSSLMSLNEVVGLKILVGVNRLILFLKWDRKLKKMTEMPRVMRYQLINELLRVQHLKSFIDESFDIKDFKLVVVFYDAQILGNYLVQLAKLNSVPTATLSHGVVLAQRDVSLIDYCGIELRGSISDYFLAWNDFSFQEAMKQGMKSEKVKVLGVPYFIDYDINSSVSERSGNEIFGVVLDNNSGDRFNKMLISISNRLSDAMNLKYTIRFHPSYKGNEYDDLINFNFYIGPDNSDSISEYAQNVNFTLLANSTVFIELIFLGHRVYRYGDNSIFDKFREYKYNSFSDFEMCEDMVSKKINCSTELFKSLCSVREVKNSYLNFFKDFVE